ncbi:nucleotidyltransferase domain-containing protein [Ornithinibacillus massiliensis]|uniref:nucleotidyltransferase domain-containing protein n=1 Tax=Ornithinibacillus massiliensis TaxID=1944633 RepID=UPI003CCE9410
MLYREESNLVTPKFFGGVIIVDENVGLETKSQLHVLSEIIEIFKELDSEFWLRGGWAIDFLLGKITRTHSDIDIVTWITTREQLEKALEKAGYEKVPVGEQFRNRQSDFRKDNVEVSFGYVTHNSDGRIILNGLPEWGWREDALFQQYFQLHGISAKVLHPKQLLEEKETYEQIGRPYRQKDAESKKLLYRIISDFNYLARY